MLKRKIVATNIRFLFFVFSFNSMTFGNVLLKYQERKIGPRWGKEFNHDWDRLIKKATSENKSDRLKAFKIILSAEIPTGTESAWYIKDLYKVFNKYPAELINYSLQYFNNHDQCLNFWLIHKTNAFPFDNYETIMKRAEANSLNKKNIQKIFIEGKKYHKALINDEEFPTLLECDFYAHKNKHREYDFQTKWKE